MKLYVGNLSFDATEAELSQLFSRFGTPESVRVVTDRDTGRSRGFGFVEFADDSAAQAAISGLDGKDFMGRALTVNEARPPRQDRDRGGHGGRGKRY